MKNISNRVRTAQHTEDDLTRLSERIRPEDHSDLKGALTHEVVNRNNDAKLRELNSELIIIEALNSHNNLPNFTPKIHPKKRTVADTPYLQRLCLNWGRESC